MLRGSYQCDSVIGVRASDARVSGHVGIPDRGINRFVSVFSFLQLVHTHHVYRAGFIRWKRDADIRTEVPDPVTTLRLPASVQ